MARSYSSIQMDFRKAKSQASALEQVAGNMKNLSKKKFDNTLNQLATNWTGDNSQKFIGKGQHLQQNMVTTAEAILDVAVAIREIARVIYEAEMEAWERAHNRD
ncbi:MAG: hypothetical protein ACRDBO_11640 [Lachnospiraceae bacterium]